MVPPLLLLIHRGPMEISKAGSGGVGGPTTTPHPQITSVHAARACLAKSQKVPDLGLKSHTINHDCSPSLTSVLRTTVHSPLQSQPFA